MQHCPNCGTPLQAIAKFCPGCGQRVSLASGPAQQPVSDLPPTPPAPPEPAMLASENYGSYGPDVVASTSQSSAPTSSPMHSISSPYHTPVSHAGQTPPSPPITPYSANPYYPPVDPAAGQKTPGMYTPPPYTPYAPPTPPVTARRKRSPVLLVLLAILLIVVVGSGISLIYYAGVALPAQANAQATSTAQAATSTANTQATSTAQAITNATATANAQATASVQQTATTRQTIYSQATSGSPVFQSSLAGPDSAGWETYNAVGGGGCHYSNGAFHASVQNQHYYVACFGLNTNYANMAFEISMTIQKGNQGGLIFRGNKNSLKFYSFRVGSDGAVALYASQDNSHSHNLFYDHSDAVKTGAGQTNIVTVIARSSTMYFYINKQYVGQVQDTAYASGQIGLLSADLSAATDVAYQNARVWQF